MNRRASARRLVAAAAAGDLPAVQALDCELVDARVGGRNALMAAVEAGSAPVVSFLLEAAARSGGPPAAAALASTPASPTGQTPLTMAVTHGTPAHLTVAAALLAAGANYLGVNARGDTPLHAAARAGRAGALRFLLSSTVRVGSRPARLAVVVVRQAPSGERARLVDARTAAGLSPLDLAVLSGSAPAVSALLAAGADGLALLPRSAPPAVRCAPGSTLLHLAAGRGMAAVAAVLVDAGAAAARRGGNGGGGADLRCVRDAFGRLPARVAESQGHTGLARALAPPPGSMDRGVAGPATSPRAPAAVLAAVARRAGLLLDLARAEGGGESGDEADAADLVAAVTATSAALGASPAPPRPRTQDTASLVRSLAIVAGGAEKVATATSSTSLPTLGAAALARAAAHAIAAACPAAAPPPPGGGASSTAGLAAGADPGAAAAFTAAVCATLAAAPADLLSATAVVIAGEPRAIEANSRQRLDFAAWMQRALGCARPGRAEDEEVEAAPSSGWAVPAGTAPVVPAPSSWTAYGGAWAHASAALEEEEEAGPAPAPFWRRRRTSSGGEAAAPAPPPPPPALPPPRTAVQAATPPPPTTCPVCLDAPPNVRAVQCGHAFCSGCVGELITRGGVLGPGPVCPLCRGGIEGVVRV